MIKKCKRCGKEFETPYPRTVYCSTRCRNIGHFRNAPTSCTRKCKNCGKTFIGQFNKLYCSAKCRAVALASSGRYRTQLCWTCQRATGYCDWSANLKPIKGWDAKLVKCKDGGHTYRIKACPLYLPDEYMTRKGENKNEKI